MKFLDRLERKHPKWGIQNLMMHISILTAIIFIVSIFRSDILYYLYLSREGILNLQLWRLITFVLVPPTYSIIWIIFALYFYYFIGTALESTWGTLKFNAYYLINMIATIVCAMIFGGAYIGLYINLSMFLAFAYLYPNQEFLLFFILPIKVKYLALVNVVFLFLNFVSGGLTTKISIIASLTGFILFFGKDFYLRIKMWIRRQKYKNKF